MKEIDKELEDYLEKRILPEYDSFDKGHRQAHARAVMEQSMELCRFYDVNPDMVLAAAAYHDTGLKVCRETHHIESGKFIREDMNLRRWFSEEQIETIACAAEDHRASLGHAPRTIYGKIVAEADRIIIPETVLRRTVQFGMKHYPELDKEGHWNRFLGHLLEKYAEGGYLRLWIPESPNAARLEELRSIIRDRDKLKSIFDILYKEENSSESSD